MVSTKIGIARGLTKAPIADRLQNAVAVIQQFCHGCQPCLQAVFPSVTQP